MAKIIHLTDTHLVARGALLHGLDPYARLKAAIRDILDKHADADVCVVTGDLTHHGLPEEYAAFQDATAGLSIPLRLLIGNHDRRDAFHDALDVPQDANGFVQNEMVVDNGETVLLFLDTHDPGTHAGRYCEVRREWLKERLAAHALRRVILFMHHAPLAVGIAPLDAFMLQDHKELAEIVQANSNIKYIVFGHIHLPVSGVWAGVPFTATRGTNHQVWLNFSADDGIPCSHEQPMVGVMFTDENTIAYHFHEYADDSKKYLYIPESH